MQIKSYVKKSGQFILIDEYHGPLKDEDYVESALVLTIDGFELITVEMWDCVDQLWEYFIDAVTEVAAGRPACFCDAAEVFLRALRRISPNNVLAVEQALRKMISLRESSC
jgi:hypothetical protein